jgi:hypothetical protein
MRQQADAERIRALARGLGRVSRKRVRIYLTGGATAVLEGGRATTLDVDLRFEPEADDLLRAIPELKERLGINVKLASSIDFIPELPGWRERSPLAFREGNVDVHHFDLYSQALSKVERGFEHDLRDVNTMRGEGWSSPSGCASCSTPSNPSPIATRRSTRGRSEPSWSARCRRRDTGLSVSASG